MYTLKCLWIYIQGCPDLKITVGHRSMTDGNDYLTDENKTPSVILTDGGFKPIKK